MATENAVIENPYGLQALWSQGGFVSKGTMMMLLIMSMMSWYVMITKAWDQRRLKKFAVAAEKDFWKAGSVRDGVALLKGNDNAFRMMAEDGLSAVQHHEGKLTDQIDLHEWITQALQRSVDSITGSLQGGLPILASVGSTAPFVGLFGTVWGIYNALISIGIAGQASIDKVAGPVGEALIMTAMGLAVAVPAVLGYNFLLRRNKVVIEKVNYFAHDLHALLLSGSRVGGAGSKTTGAGGTGMPAPALKR
jgi:biopolymer transport protein ExbB